MDKLPFIKGCNFACFTPKGTLDSEETYFSFNEMLDRTNSNFITLIPNGLQETAQSEEISYDLPATMTDDELTRFIDYAHEKGVMVSLKPTVNCMNGTWRAHISFFDKDVVCEPKWSEWFKSYTDFQLHYAEIARKTGCEMFISGCEMVQSEKRESEWRRLISDIRSEYKGPVSYNTDKYQEENVTWWDAVDYISSSGYYPVDKWNENLDRIEKTVLKYNKPFFFAEAGCMSVKGSSLEPNNWRFQGEIALDEQAAWFDAMFSEGAKREWLNGFCIWDWKAKIYQEEKGREDSGYAVYGKPAAKVIHDFYKSFNR